MYLQEDRSTISEFSEVEGRVSQALGAVSVLLPYYFQFAGLKPTLAICCKRGKEVNSKSLSVT